MRPKSLLRRAFLVLLPGVITILCHGADFLQTPRWKIEAVPGAGNDAHTHFRLVKNAVRSVNGSPGPGEQSGSDVLSKTAGASNGTEGGSDDIGHTRTGFHRVNMADAVSPALQPITTPLEEATAFQEKITGALFRRQDNVKPRIDGQAPDPLVTPEEQPITVTLDNLSVTDPDDDYPNGFSMTVKEGPNYTIAGLTITPSPDFNGMLYVPVTVNDGEADSKPYSVRISVTAVNDRPLITGQNPDPMTAIENQSLAIALSNLAVTDPDNVYPADFILTIMSGSNYTVSSNTITPANGFTGTLSVSVTVSDPFASSDAFALQVSVAPNTRPVITGQTTLTTNEETPLTIALENLIISDPDSDPEDLTFRLLPGSGYSVDGDIVLPDKDLAGTLSVPVIVNDGTSDSESFDLQITVENVNDAPQITAQASLTTSENETIAIALSDLTVVDPDNDYPGAFTLSLIAGENYSVSGNQVTPAPGFNGTLTVPVFVNDGIENSNVFSVVINVDPVNDPPVITGQRALEVTEDDPITLSLQDLTVSDPDNVYPDAFTLAVQPGSDYSFSATTVTPAENYTGVLFVNVIVNDGMTNSEPYAVQVSVIPVNDAPVITGPATLSTTEDVPRTIEPGDLLVTDPDNAYPSGFTLSVFPGANYTVSGNTVTPAANFSGTLNVQVQVNDGLLNSNVFDLTLEVVEENDPPVITGQVPVETGEDTPVTLALSDLSVLDVDNTYPAGFSLIISPGSNYTFSDFTITPALDFNGTLNVNVMVNDGTANSAPFLFQIQVGDANDAPVITGQTPLATDEEKAVSIQLSHLIVSDPDNPYPTGFTLLISPGINYTVDGQTITPDVDFAGTLTVPVRVNDGINNSATFDFQLVVNQVNDPPGFAAIPNQQITENTAAGSITITGISKGPFEGQQELTFFATSGNTGVIEDPVIRYSGAGTTATLSYVVKPNMSGIVTVTVLAVDNGSNIPPNRNSYSSSFQIEVLEINDQPTIDPVSNITLLEDAEQQNISLTGISAGPGETQTLTVSVTSDKPEFFDLLDVVYTSPESTGLLRFKPKINIFGTARLSVSVTDNGSGVSPNVNTITRSFNVVIQPVNDPPVFTSSPVTLAAVDEEYEYRITASDPDGDKLAFTAAEKPSWTSLDNAGNGVAKLRGKPPVSALGNATVKLQAKDGSATVEQAFTLYINARPAVTSMKVVTEEDRALFFSRDFFSAGYSDLNEDPLAAIQVTRLPASGKLSLSETEVKVADTIPAGLLSGLVYAPAENYFGMDSFGWKAYDGHHFSLTGGRVDVSVLSINDPPRVIFEHDTLQYEVNGEPAFLSPGIAIADPDDDTLTYVAIAFKGPGYLPELDILEFSNTGNIRGTFNFQTGTLDLRGTAPVSDYVTALRSVRYVHRNTLDPVLEPKTVSFTLNDGEVDSEPQDKVILLQYTFIEFSIPSGFTPNGDHANDTWVIERPGGGLDDLDDAVISVYNKKGVLVFRTKGFDRPWDGTMNGERLPADSYFFTIDLQLRNKKTYKGVVTILR